MHKKNNLNSLGAVCKIKSVIAKRLCDSKLSHTKQNADIELTTIHFALGGLLVNVEKVNFFVTSGCDEYRISDCLNCFTILGIKKTSESKVIDGSVDTPCY